MFDWLKSLFAKDVRSPMERSSRWSSVREVHLRSHPCCEVCGSKNNVEVHHILPYHLYPEEELNFRNLITLCENKSRNCHFLFGHCLNWKHYNMSVRLDAAYFREMLKNACVK